MIPTKLKIGGHDYTVELTERENIEDALGEHDRHRNRIRICQTDPITQQEETLLHEIIHAVNGGLKEDLVDGLACSLYQVLHDNKIRFDD